jgi:hypothetical protein
MKYRELSSYFGETAKSRYLAKHSSRSISFQNHSYAGNFKIWLAGDILGAIS